MCNYEFISKNTLNQVISDNISITVTSKVSNKSWDNDILTNLKLKNLRELSFVT